MGVIYKINIGDHFYIGQTTNIKSRMNNHRRELNNQKHCNSYMQNAFNKYGDFNYEILFTCTENYLDIVEQELIDMYKGKKGFMNMMLSVKTPRGENHSWTGKKHTDEAKEKMSLAAKNRNKASRARKVIDISNGYVFNTVKDAAKSVNLKARTLNAMLTGQNPNKTNLKYL
jgi:group I intron endonuclease